jgi:hypothetical protein
MKSNKNELMDNLKNYSVFIGFRNFDHTQDEMYYIIVLMCV